MSKIARRILACIVSGCLLLYPDAVGVALATDVSPSELVSFEQGEQDAELLSAYEELCGFIAEHELPASISLEAFIQSYEEGDYTSVANYIQEYYDIFDVSDDRESTGYTLSRSNWYYNTGTNLTAMPNYSKYNLLSVVKPGDIIYEDAGGSGLTGHISIVEGIYYDAFYGRYYIRIVEAIGYISGSGQGDGVCRGVLDDDRLDNREGTILRPAGASDTAIANAVAFCVGQIGKGYYIDLFKNTSTAEKNWYCSELVWAAYYNQGINIENDTIVGITPKEILASSNVTTVSVSTFGTPQNVQVSMSGSSGVQITWSAVSGATEYDVYLGESSEGTFSYLGSTTSTSFSMSGFLSGGVEYFRIQACKNSILGNKSDPLGIKNTFTAPSIVNIYTPSSTSVKLTWTSVYNATSYRVYRSLEKGEDTFTLVGTSSTTSFTDTGLTSGERYYYRVAAVNGSEVTSLSSYKTRIPTKVLTPQIYYGDDLEDNGSLTIKWSYIPGASSYYVYCADDFYNPVFVKIGASTKTSYNFTSAETGTLYCFRIVAHSDDGDSSFSESFYASI